MKNIDKRLIIIERYVVWSVNTDEIMDERVRSTLAIYVGTRSAKASFYARKEQALKDCHITPFDWPPPSPDMNRIEQMWN